MTPQNTGEIGLHQQQVPRVETKHTRTQTVHNPYSPVRRGLTHTIRTRTQTVHARTWQKCSTHLVVCAGLWSPYGRMESGVSILELGGSSLGFARWRRVGTFQSHNTASPLKYRTGDVVLRFKAFEIAKD